MQAVHFIEPTSWRIASGWINPDRITTVRAARLSLAEGLCPKCAERAEGLAAHCPLLSVRLAGQVEPVLVLGDGRHGDERAVRAAQRLGKIRARCEEEHLDADAEGFALPGSNSALLDAARR